MLIGSWDVSDISTCILLKANACLNFIRFIKRIWNSRVEKPSYRLWRHKTKLSQIVTSQIFFFNSETLNWKNENKKTELRISEISFKYTISELFNSGFFFSFFYFKISEFRNSEVLFSLKLHFIFIKCTGLLKLSFESNCKPRQHLM